MIKRKENNIFKCKSRTLRKKAFHAILISRLKKSVKSPSVLYELPTLENP